MMLAVGDYDNDGQLDALLVGNSYDNEVGTGRYDAFEGLYLKGDGRGNFVPISASESGFLVDSDAKSIVRITLASQEPLLVVGSNGDSLRAFTFDKSSAKPLSLRPLPNQ